MLMTLDPFHWTKRLLAMLWMAQCLVLSAQTSSVLVDQVRHAFGVAHAPNAVAGTTIFDHDDRHGHEHDTRVPHRHSHGEHHAANGEPIQHEHAGDGMLMPWVGVPSYEVLHFATATTVRPAVMTSQDYPFQQRQDRPPKRILETL